MDNPYKRTESFFFFFTEKVSWFPLTVEFPAAWMRNPVMQMRSRFRASEYRFWKLWSMRAKEIRLIHSKIFANLVSATLWNIYGTLSVLFIKYRGEIGISVKGETRAYVERVSLPTDILNINVSSKVISWFLYLFFQQEKDFFLWLVFKVLLKNPSKVL